MPIFAPLQRTCVGGDARSVWQLGGREKRVQACGSRSSQGASPAHARARPPRAERGGRPGAAHRRVLRQDGDAALALQVVAVHHAHLRPGVEQPD